MARGQDFPRMDFASRVLWAMFALGFLLDEDDEEDDQTG